MRPFMTPQLQRTDICTVDVRKYDKHSPPILCSKPATRFFRSLATDQVLCRCDQHGEHNAGVTQCYTELTPEEVVVFEVHES